MPQVRHLRRLALTLAAVASATACQRQPPPAAADRFAGAPIVLISIDTLRADHLPAYGYRGGSTPAIDRLARAGIVFDDVYSQCPLTLPSHASLFTGRLPLQSRGSRQHRLHGRGRRAHACVAPQSGWIRHRRRRLLVRAAASDGNRRRVRFLRRRADDRGHRRVAVGDAARRRADDRGAGGMGRRACRPAAVCVPSPLRAAHALHAAAVARDGAAVRRRDRLRRRARGTLSRSLERARAPRSRHRRGRFRSR